MFQSSHDLLIISTNDTLIFFNKTTQEKLAEYKHTGKTLLDSAPAKKKAKPCESRVDNPDVIHFDIKKGSNSNAAKLVVVYNDKTAKFLEFLKNEDETFELRVIKEWSLQKRPTSIKIIEEKNCVDIVVVDKAGDVYRLYYEGDKTLGDTNLGEKKLGEKNLREKHLVCSTETPVLGHISMLLDLVLTEQYLITAERDEKIKVSDRKRPVDIHGYLLGHTQFVKSIFEVDRGLLVSFGGDYQVKLWDLESCEEIDSYSLPDTTLHVFQSSSSTSHFTAITRDCKLHQFSMNGTTKKLEENIEIKDDELTSKLFERRGGQSKLFSGVPEGFMTGKRDCENFDKLFKNSEFTKY